MLGEGGTPLAELVDAINKFLAREDRPVDLKLMRKSMDALEGDFSVEARRSQLNGDHLTDGSAGVVTWLSRLCGMSATSVADRVCVGKQLEALPKIAEALRSGAIGYQSTALLCHLREQVGDQRELFVEDEMLEHARNNSVGGLRYLCRVARHVADPDGFFNEAEADYSRRRLDISQMGDGMFCVDAILDPVAGAALKTALDSLAKRLGPDDDRSHKQRMADSVNELVHHAMDEGRLPRRNGVKPQPQCDNYPRGAEERAWSAAGGPRALAADLNPDFGAHRLRLHDLARAARQVNWSTPHHIDFWARGGPNKLPNLVLLCYFHHRLVHEGGWQVVKAGRDFRFLPPDRVVFRRARGPGIRWAA
jgi:hypothetical protein